MIHTYTHPEEVNVPAVSQTYKVAFVDNGLVGRMKEVASSEVTEEGKKNNEKGQVTTTLKTVWDNFCQETTCHGLGKFIINDKIHKIRRIFWLIIVIASLSFLAFVISREIEIYYTFPSFTKICVEPVDEQNFPAVTICNLSPRSRAKLNESERLENYHMSISDIHAYASPINWSDPIYKEEGYFSHQNLDEVIAQTRTAGQLFTYCQFDHVPYDCEQEFFEQRITDLGVCFTWNPKGNFSTTRAGATNNFAVTVNVNVSDYSWSNDVATGIKVVIHDFLDEPDLENGGFVVKPGNVAYTSILHKQYRFLKSPYQEFNGASCVDRETSAIEYPHQEGDNYNQLTCLKHCRAQHMKSVCNCVSLSDPGGPYCSLYQVKECYIPEMLKVKSRANAIKCNCPAACTFDQYEPLVSYAEFPSPFVGAKLVKRQVAESVASLRENFLMLKIYFGEKARYNIHQVAKYESMLDVLGNLGGQMGLFLGASLLTLTEICEFIVSGMVTLLAVIWDRKTKMSS